MTAQQSRLRVRKQDQITVVEFVDRNILDEANIAQIGEEIGALVNDDPSPKLLISFANVDHLSSAALGALITINSRIKAKDGQLRLADINSQIIEVFRITRLDRLFQIHPGTREALASFS
ncbi:MAG: STAS domain-containing protein [Phycisphaerales bacterium]|nr:STAS domain-containing protein [Phycisphaerales bacterium]